MEELKEKYTKIVLWFFGLLALISLLAHFSLKDLVEEEAASVNEEQMVKIIEAVQKQEQQDVNQNQYDEPQQEPVVENQEPQEDIEAPPQKEIILED